MLHPIPLPLYLISYFPKGNSSLVEPSVERLTGGLCTPAVLPGAASAPIGHGHGHRQHTNACAQQSSPHPPEPYRRRRVGIRRPGMRPPRQLSSPLRTSTAHSHTRAHSPGCCSRWRRAAHATASRLRPPQTGPRFKLDPAACARRPQPRRSTLSLIPGYVTAG